MTVHADILKELLIAGYEGAHLHDAFERLCASLTRHGVGAGSIMQKIQIAPVAKMNEPANSVRIDVATAERAMPPPVVVVAPPEHAKAIARKALAQSGLASTAIAVGSQLIEHFNLDTGRCDPGITSLATKACVAPRSARRAISSLVGAGLFGVVRHGGRNHANAYQPNWPELVRLSGEVDMTRPVLSADPAKFVPQNHLRKPDSESLVERPQRKRGPVMPDRRQISMMLPINGSAEVARDNAHKRIWQGFQQHIAHLDKAQRGAMFEAYTALGLHEQSISAEMHKAGSGLAVLLRALHEEALRATG